MCPDVALRFSSVLPLALFDSSIGVTFVLLMHSISTRS